MFVFALHACLSTADSEVSHAGENCCSVGGANCGAAGNDNMPDWDVSLVTNMDELFDEKYNLNQ